MYKQIMFNQKKKKSCFCRCLCTKLKNIYITIKNMCKKSKIDETNNIIIKNNKKYNNFNNESIIDFSENKKKERKEN